MKVAAAGAGALLDVGAVHSLVVSHMGATVTATVTALSATATRRIFLLSALLSSPTDPQEPDASRVPPAPSTALHGRLPARLARGRRRRATPAGQPLAAGEEQAKGRWRPERSQP